mgnify:CR=1 FL=1
MKKIIFFALILLLTPSCVEEPVVSNTIRVIPLSVTSTQWVRVPEKDGLNHYYMATFTVPEISNYIYNNGVINMYRTYDNSTQPLPVVLHQENEQGNRWTQTIDYEYKPGIVQVFVTNSDFFDVVPTAMNFKVTMIW